jgi:methionyl aminopeptidase
LIRIKNSRDVDLMRVAGRALADVFVEVAPLMESGMVTREIDDAVETAIRRHGAKPAFKGYRGGAKTKFPASVCISIDAEVVHGIPSSRRLQSGQLVGLDAGLELDGWFADMAASFLIGETSDIKRRLWKTTKESLYRGINEARAGRWLSEIGGAVQDYVEEHGFSVIRDLVGHGIGAALHEEPAVPNYRTRDGNVVLRAGMTLAIEPMVAAGGHRIKTLSDGWTATTSDASPSCHFEHTVLITDGEPEILTLTSKGNDPWLTPQFEMREVCA